VTDGDARILITAVGPKSEWGMIMEKVTVDDMDETPLQKKLGALLKHSGPLRRPVLCIHVFKERIVYCTVDSTNPKNAKEADHSSCRVDKCLFLIRYSAQAIVHSSSVCA
jgi:hypothetical protein